MLPTLLATAGVDAVPETTLPALLLLPVVGALALTGLQVRATRRRRRRDDPAEHDVLR